MPRSKKTPPPASCPAPPPTVREELLRVMGEAPPAARRAMADLLLSVKAGMDASLRKPTFVDARARGYD